MALFLRIRWNQRRRNQLWPRKKRWIGALGTTNTKNIDRTQLLLDEIERNFPRRHQKSFEVHLLQYVLLIMCLNNQKTDRKTSHPGIKRFRLQSILANQQTKPHSYCQVLYRCEYQHIPYHSIAKKHLNCLHNLETIFSVSINRFSTPFLWNHSTYRKHRPHRK